MQVVFYLKSGVTLDNQDFGKGIEGCHLLLADRGAGESATRGGLLLLGQLLLGTVQNLEERLDTKSHASVEVRLGALDVIHEVVAEDDGHVDRLGSRFLLEVAIKEHLGDEAVRLSKVLNRSNLSRGCGLGEVDRGGTTDGLFELLDFGRKREIAQARVSVRRFDKA
jgi:hypothetical protein